MDEIRRVIMGPKKAEEQWMDWTYYLLQKNGGFLWPGFYALLLWRAWSMLGDGWRVFFASWLALGIVVMLICLVFGRLYIGKVKTEIKSAVDQVEVSWVSYSSGLNAKDHKTAMELGSEREATRDAILKLRYATGTYEAPKFATWGKETEERF